MVIKAAISSLLAFRSCSALHTHSIEPDPTYSDWRLVWAQLMIKYKERSVLQIHLPMLPISFVKLLDLIWTVLEVDEI